MGIVFTCFHSHKMGDFSPTPVLNICFLNEKKQLWIYNIHFKRETFTASFTIIIMHHSSVEK